jgi:hypothetical protein
LRIATSFYKWRSERFSIVKKEPTMRKNGAIIAGFVALGIVAVAGWARRPVAPSPMNFNPVPVYASNPYNPAQAGSGVQPAAYFTPIEPYADRQYVRVVRQQPVVEREVVRQPVVERRVVREAPAIQKERSTAKSAAIVAGSAGVGAAVGAIAGGGKGAAIGAISGGAAGFVYDRLTHKR